MASSMMSFSNFSLVDLSVFSTRVLYVAKVLITAFHEQSHAGKVFGLQGHKTIIANLQRLT